MVGWILAAMAADLVHTKAAEAEKQKRIKRMGQLQFLLGRPATRTHFMDCRCGLCRNRRTAWQAELDRLKCNC
jgi:ribosomal protein S27E